MIAAILIAVLGVAVIAALGAALGVASVRAARSAGGAERGPVERWHRVRGALLAELPAWAVALAVGAAGAGLTFAVGWPLGRLAHALESSVDVPVFGWFRDRVQAGGWSSLQSVLTQMGNRPQIKVVAVVAAIALAVAWRRRWFVPVVTIAVAFFVEKYVQAGLAAVVDRGHPPTSHGTYPSGGCARLISMYGTILYLTLRVWRPPVWACAALWTALAEAAWLEGYARTYRLEHWFTDVVGGWVIGICLLATFVLIASALSASPVPSLLGARRPGNQHG